MPIGPQSLQNFQASNFNTDTNVGMWKAKQDANSAIAFATCWFVLTIGRQVGTI
jgi:hypothetical protein